MAARLIRLCEAHGVHRNQIPRFVGHALTLQDVQDDASVLAKLDEPLLEHVCARFAIRREWLDGAHAQIHPQHRFYKSPQEFSAFITALRSANPNGSLSGVVLAPNDHVPNAEALLILQETIGAIGERSIYRYHVCDGWPFSYWKARAYLAACIAIAWRHHVYIHGRCAPADAIARLASGTTLLGWQGEGIWTFGMKQWHPEDMALRPDAFLDGIDPEENHFGLRAGLQLWLELERDGFMELGLGKSARPLFTQALARWAS
ncbi:hypothetical protein E4K72_05990 [Oxalobacteraceae bacterium OM1]|nr:hypothetical protein E4K72_05990 [Oxalobacteraceae bacterium OM1]